MAINQQIPQDQWQEFFTTFSNGNRGRQIGLEVFDQVTGDSGVQNQGKLMAVDCDSIDKGNDIVVTTGEAEIGYSHTIKAPVEVWQAQHDNGEVSALEIIDQNNSKTVLIFR